MIKSLFCVFSLIIIATGPAFAANLSLSQALDKTEIPFEETAELTFTLSWDGPQSAYLFTKPLQPTVDRMKVQKFSSTISSVGSGPDEKTTKIYKFTLQPESPGIANIQPVTIEYLTWPDSIPGQVVSEPMSLVIDEPVPVVEKKGLPIGTFIIIVVVVIAFGSSVMIFVIARARKKRESVPVLTSEQKFLEKLAKLKLDTGSDLKRFQTGLYKILIEYLNEKYGLELAGLSSQDIVEKLNAVEMDGSVKGKVTGWLMRAEKEKFTPQGHAPGETIRLEAEIRTFFESL